MKPTLLSDHAIENLEDRGTNLEEIEEAIASAEWQPAKVGRLECSKDFVFGGEWKGKIYNTKQVRPIFVEGPDQIIVVTVYVYYF